MIKAKLKKIKPKTLVISKDKSHYTMFMEEMKVLIGKVFEYEKVNENEYKLARTEFNYTHGLVDEYFYLAIFVYEWLDVVSKDFSTDELKLPDWIDKIITQNVL